MERIIVNWCVSKQTITAGIGEEQNCYPALREGIEGDIEAIVIHRHKQLKKEGNELTIEMKKRVNGVRVSYIYISFSLPLPIIFSFSHSPYLSFNPFPLFFLCISLSSSLKFYPTYAKSYRPVNYHIFEEPWLIFVLTTFL